LTGEFELIAAIRERVARAGAPAGSPGLVIGSGDDAAVTERQGAAVTSVDALVEGVHFEAPPFELRQVGSKALAVALSDLAAMGATPAEAYVQLGVPEGRSDAELLELADGLAAIAAEYGVAIAGGDVTRAPVLLLAVTVVGAAPSAADLVTRAGARSGDVVTVTGELGGAAAGLLLLQRPELGEGLDPAIAAALRERQLEPAPLLAAGRGLAQGRATALIDVSDGLGADAGHLAAASGVAIEIELDRVPVQAGVEAAARGAGADPADLVAGGGEDYELLATIPPERLTDARDLLKAVGVELTAIGAVSVGEGVTLSDRRGGGARPPSGFDQLRRRPAPGAPS
jgi:thiamine-monophosphate kinase